MHLRDRPDREEALRELAKNTDMSDDFQKAVLIHLCLDYLWDTSHMKDYIIKTGEEWFRPYRNELAISASYLYRHTPQSKKIWDDMLLVSPDEYCSCSDYTKDNIRAFLVRNAAWHEDNTLGPSEAFPPAIINTFTQKATQSIRCWLEAQGAGRGNARLF